MAELNQKRWAARPATSWSPNEPNANDFDMNLFRRGSYVSELETRYSSIAGGKARAVRHLGSHVLSPGPITRRRPRRAQSGPCPTERRRADPHGRTKYGYYLNLQQAYRPDRRCSPAGVGTTARARSPPSPISTRACRSALRSREHRGAVPTTASAWPSHGTAFNRPQRDFIAAGGLGILIGDGRLNYASENILETFYALQSPRV